MNPVWSITVIIYEVVYPSVYDLLLCIVAYLVHKHLAKS
jgi:hypothetical protein